MAKINISIVKPNLYFILLTIAIYSSPIYLFIFYLFNRSSSQLNGTTNPYSWLKPNVQNLSSGNSGGPINLLTNVRSSQEIPEIITGNKLSTNDTEKKLKANMAIVQANCMSKSLQNSKAQSNVGSGDPQPPPRRQVRL